MEQVKLDIHNSNLKEAKDKAILLCNYFLKDKSSFEDIEHIGISACNSLNAKSLWNHTSQTERKNTVFNKIYYFIFKQWTF